MSSRIRLHRLDGDGVEREVALLQRTYESMYGMAPGDADFVPTLLAEHAARDGFRLCAAYASEGTMVGLAYGFTGSPGQVWRDEMAAAVGDEVAAVWLDGHFEFAEFGVVPVWRRRGIASALYGDVFEDLPHVRSVLTVRDDNEPALAFYTTRDWSPIFEGFVPTGGHGPYTIMGKVLQTG